MSNFHQKDPDTALRARISCGFDDDDEVAEQSARRRRRSDLEGDELAESSAASRRHSRILSRWAARQAEEMITNIERRNRESELMALAGLHAVSMLDSSFLCEGRRVSASPPIDRQTERPVVARAQSMLQMWRELEEMSDARRERRNSVERRPVENLVGIGEEQGENVVDRNVGEEEGEGGGRLSRERSPDEGEVERERERVRQIVGRWMSESGIDETESRGSPRNESQRGEWLGEVERERVRLVREWVQMASQQERDAQSSRREGRTRERDGSDHEDGQPEHVRRELLRLRGRQARLELIMRMASERTRELESLSESHPVSEFAHSNRIQALLRGRFLRNGRSTEDEQERVPSAATRELGQLMQHHRVSGIREGFRFRLENIVRGQAISQADSTANQSNNGPRSDQSQGTAVLQLSNDTVEQGLISSGDNSHQSTAMQVPLTLEAVAANVTVEVQESANDVAVWQEGDSGDARDDWDLGAEARFRDWNGESGFERNWQESMDQDWQRETLVDVDGEDSQMPEVQEEWHEDVSPDTRQTWQDEQVDAPMDQRATPTRRVNRFIPPDDENVYSMELRELLSRRSVSNLLHSGFRESLDQLIQTYVQRQGTAPFDWGIQRPFATPNSPEEDPQQQNNGLDQGIQGADTRPPPPLPPRQPIWHSGFPHTNWARQNMHRSEMELDVFNDLRGDMTRLQQQMSNMQRMLEACMDMQLELQRSVKQEVSAALNRFGDEHGLRAETSDDGSKWSQVKKGTCCICCDSNINSLLYRCGHMCTCSKCANELIRSGGKCPLCRAPIMEVVRAYSIL